MKSPPHLRTQRERRKFRSLDFLAAQRFVTNARQGRKLGYFAMSITIDFCNTKLKKCISPRYATYLVKVDGGFPEDNYLISNDCGDNKRQENVLIRPKILWNKPLTWIGRLCKSVHR